MIDIVYPRLNSYEQTQQDRIDQQILDPEYAEMLVLNGEVFRRIDNEWHWRGPVTDFTCVDCGVLFPDYGSPICADCEGGPA